MVQVSRRILNQKVEDRIISLFISSIILCSSKDEAISLIEDLLTPTEKIMLSKRFSIAFMLLNGYDYGTISNMLKVSTSTVSGVALWLKMKGKGFRYIIKKLKEKEASREILKSLYEVFAELLAQTPGRDWKQARKDLWLRRRAQKKPF